LWIIHFRRDAADGNGESSFDWLSGPIKLLDIPGRISYLFPDVPRENFRFSLLGTEKDSRSRDGTSWLEKRLQKFESTSKR